MEFVCRYVHDLDYNNTLYRQVRRQNMWGSLFWWIFLIFSAGMGVYCYRAAREFTWQCALYALFFLACALQIFGTPLLVRRAWKKNCAKWGRDRFETTVAFGDSVHYTDETGMEADIPWNKIAELERSGPLFILRGAEVETKRNGRKRLKTTDYLYFPAAGFSDGTGTAFLEWLTREHPKVSQRGM